MDYLLVFLMSFDAMLACIALGAQGIHTPLRSRLVIAGVGTGCLALSFLCSELLRILLPAVLFHYISCGALLVIALLCLFEEGCKRLSARLAAHAAALTFRLHSLRVVLQICAEPAEADADRSGELSSSEALLLALPLSLDSLLTGLSIRAAPETRLALLALSMTCGLASVSIGGCIGRRLGHAAGQSASLFSGLLLLMAALCKLRLI